MMSATLLPGELISVARVIKGPSRRLFGSNAPTPPPSTQRMKAQRRSNRGRNNSLISRQTAASNAAAAVSRDR